MGCSPETGASQGLPASRCSLWAGDLPFFLTCVDLDSAPFNAGLIHQPALQVLSGRKEGDCMDNACGGPGG